MKRFWQWTSAVFFLLLCIRPTAGAEAGKLTVVTTLFPLYDFARQIGQDKVDVSLLLPPGVEPHSFEPTPRDMVRINQADVFIYTSAVMEPWAMDIKSGMTGHNTVIVSAGQSIVQAEPEIEHGQAHHHDGMEQDPHIWVDFGYAMAMADTIAAGLAKADEPNRAFYLHNAAGYKRELEALDRDYRNALARCPDKLIVHGGHFAFGYMAKRYGLGFKSAYRGFSPDSEPTPKQMVGLIRQIKQHHIRYIFFEELLDPKIAKVIQAETGVQLLLLHGAHNVSKKELDEGETYIQIMRRNLADLVKGLGG